MSRAVRRLVGLGLAVGLFSTLVPPAAAQAPAPAPISEGDAIDGATGAERRDPAYFHGRTRETTAEEVLLWIPRILFYPLHLVAEIVRLPILAFLAWAEENHILGVLPMIFHPVDVLYWHPDLSLEAGIFALPGLTIRFQDLGVEGHRLRLHGAFGGDDFWSLGGEDRWQFGPVRFGVNGGYARRPNGQFFGVGPASTGQFLYYDYTRGDATAFVVVGHQNHVEAELRAGYAHEEIGAGRAPSIDPSPESTAALGLGTFDLALVSFELRLDTRANLDEQGGFHMHASVLYGVAPSPPSTQFLRVDADVEAAAELGYPDRVLALRVRIGETVSLDGGPIPFQHLPSLGWDAHRGFVGGRFRGEATAMAEIRYRYPVHYFVDMEWTVSAGNAFARDFADFSFGALTGSLSVGFRTRRTGLDPFTLGLGFGTSRFDQAFEVQSVRFYIATVEGL